MLTATREFGYGNGPSRKYRLGGDMDFQLAVLAGVLGVLLTYVVTWLHERLRPNVASLEPVQERVDRLTGTLGDAMRALAATSEELQQEVDRGRQLVAKLEADARTYEELARVNRAQAEAVATLVRGELESEGRRSFWKQFVMNRGFFLAGVAVTVLVPAVVGS
jgi:hypothetical protein